MSSINPLFKSYDLPDGNVITMMGGGSKVKKPLYTSYQNRGPKIVIAKKSGSNNYNEHGKVTVGFSTDFDDTFGTILSHLYTTMIDDTHMTISAQAIDSFSINTGETSIEFRVLNVQRNLNDEYDLTSSTTIQSLLGASTLISSVRSIEMINTPTDLSVTNDVNSPNSVQNKSPQYREFGTAYQTNFQIEDYVLHQYTQRDANGSILRDTFNNPLSSNIYGPVTYDVLLFAKDLNNSSTNQYETTSVMRRYVDIEGLDNVQLTIDNGEAFANVSDTLTLTWQFANVDESITNFNNVYLFKNNVSKEEITGVALSPISKNGSQYSVTVNNLSAIEDIGFRGEIKAYVQWKHVHWSPLNTSSPVVFSYSSQPLNDFIIYVSNSKSVYSSLLDTQLYFKLQNNINYNNYFATSRPHIVTFRIHDNVSRSEDSIVYTIPYNGITNTNITIFPAQIITGLLPNTEYFVSYTVDDGRNPTYTGTIVNSDPTTNGGYKTRLDDVIAPTISNFLLIPMESSIRVRATIQDETALRDIKIIAIAGDETNKTNTELQTQRFDTALNQVTFDASGLTEYTVDTTIDKAYKPQGAELLTETLYTIVMRCSDRGDNTAFAKATTTTTPDIRIQNVLFEPKYQRYQVSADLEFSDIPGVNIDYYMGVVTSNIDSTNEANVIDLLTDPAQSDHFLLGTNIDASTAVRVQGDLSSAFDVVTRARSSIDNFNYYNLVVYAKGSTGDYAFVTTLYQTQLQYKTDIDPPVISNIHVVFNVNMG